MLKRFAVLMILLALLVLAAGCAPGPAQPTELPTPTPPEAAGEITDEIRATRDAALSYLSQNYGDQAPAPGLTWAEKYITPGGLLGWSTYEFTAEDWLVTIGHAVVPPAMRRYEVTVENPTTGFWWEGRLDPGGHVTEGPEMVLTALDAALTSISENYPEQAPAPDLGWEGGRTTPEGLVGSETFQYTAGDWMVTISYPVVAPENVIYQIVVENPATGFRWEGKLDAEGNLTETAAPTAGDFQPLNASECSELADSMAQTLGVEATMAEAPFEDYIERKAGRGCEITATGTGLDFESFRTASEDLFWTLFEHLKAMLTAQGWQEDIKYQADGPTGTGTGLRKEGGLCLLMVGWEPSEDADCPTDQPIYECELTPEQQIYTIVLNCAEAATEDQYEGWNTYTSEKFGYTLKYPGDAQVMGTDLDQSVQFVGPIVNDEHWPYFSVDHNDSDVYRPPVGTDVQQWLVDTGISYQEMAPELEIAGLPAVHLIFEGSPQAYAFDEYYFIRGDQLFHITILHTGGQQDWDLYNKFLRSFTFAAEVTVEGQPLTLEALKNAAYFSEWPADGVAQLVDGKYEDEIAPGSASKLVITFYQDMYAFGDLDDDGVDDAAVVLATSGGGSGTFISLEAVINDQGTPHHVATASLGDRVQVKSVAIEAGVITVDMVTHGPDDSLCCPTLEVTQKYELQGGELVELSSGG